MEAIQPSALPTCPGCRTTLMWPVRGGWHCDECDLVMLDPAVDENFS